MQEKRSGASVIVPASQVPRDLHSVSLMKRHFKMVLRELEVHEDDAARLQREAWEVGEEARIAALGAIGARQHAADATKFEQGKPGGDELGCVLRILGEELAQPVLCVSQLPPLPDEYVYAGSVVHLSPTHYTFGEGEHGSGAEASCGAHTPLLFMSHSVLHPEGVQVLHLVPPDGQEGTGAPATGVAGSGRRRGWHWERVSGAQACGPNLVRCYIGEAGTYAAVHAHYGAERVMLDFHCSSSVVAGAHVKPHTDLELRVWAYADRPGQAARVAVLERTLARSQSKAGWSAAADAECGRIAEPLEMRRSEKLRFVGGRAAMVARSVRRPSIQQGQTVQARWRGDETIGWYDACVQRVYQGSEGSASAQFNLSFDGKVAKAVPRKQVATKIHVDDRVMASAGIGAPWFGALLPGRVLRAKNNGSYDVLLDDGSPMGLEQRLVDRSRVCPLPDDHGVPMLRDEHGMLESKNVLEWMGEPICTVVTVPMPQVDSGDTRTVYEDKIYIVRDMAPVLTVNVRIPIFHGDGDGDGESEGQGRGK